ncbi:MAG: energy-coupling factor ABC transporter permease [Proteobacteria bacterium]|nr:energy-coupling factor ABC transporter permease [Pseudomonadota bacterium]
MNIPYGVLSSVWVWACWTIAALSLLWAIASAPWHKVRKDWVAQAVFGAAVFVVFALWSIKASIGPGLGFHFLGATVLTLMFGWQFALVALALVLSLTTFLGGAGWDAWGANFVALAITPVMVTWWALRLSYHYLPRNFFLYVFLNAFLVAAFAMLVSVAVLSCILIWGDVISWSRLSYQFLPMLPMMMGPEAFVNGFIMTVLVVNRVEWVSTFTDEQYIHGK